jgi:hypothetical protein
VSTLSLAGVISAVAAGTSLWMQSRQHESLASSYGLTALDIANLLDSLTQIQAEQDWAEVVDQAEEAISREHATWQASRSDTRLGDAKAD